MSDPFARMTKSIFARLGGGAFLRGAEACSADVHHGVAIASTGEFGEVTSFKTVVNIDYGVLPKPKTDDTLLLNGTTYTLDSLLKDDGYSARWIVV
jgi:hypothetical protein